MGFKSFLDPTEITFSSGLTGIVGPNGCGKSNIVEAIKWAMGENSPKKMRSQDMDSVIFSGTENRPSRNYSEVIIKIDNTDKKAPYPFTNVNEIEISRKLERDKGSTYKINGKIARARDIQLIFADTATGAKSSSIVGQGKISEIIEAKAEVRRSIIEEAANITGLHSRKHEAKLKLNSANENIERLSDIENTFKGQINDLAKQARQASRYRSIGERLKKAETEYFLKNYIKLEFSKKAYTADHKTNFIKIESFQTKIAQLETKKLNFFNKIPTLKEINKKKLEVVQNLKIGKIKIEQEINTTHRSKSLIESQILQIEEETIREKNIIKDADKTLIYLDNEIKKLTKDGYNFSKLLNNAKKNTIEIRKKLEKSNKDLTAINSKILSLSKNKKELNDRLELVSNEKIKIKDKLSSLDTKKDIEQLNTFNEIKLNLNKKFYKLKASQEIEQKKLNSIQTEFNNSKVEELNLEKNISNLKTEISTIESFINFKEEDTLENSMSNMSALEYPIASILGHSLSASIVNDTNNNKEQFWLKNVIFEKELKKLPLASDDLSQKINKNAILKNALKGVGIVDSVKTAFELQSQLEHGQSLTTAKGGIWRWDGYVELPSAKNSFANKLMQKNKYKSLNISLVKKIKELEICKSKNSKIEPEVLKYISNINKTKTDVKLIEDEINELNLQLSLLKSKISQSTELIVDFNILEKENNKRLNDIKNQLRKYKSLSILQTDELKLRNDFENLNLEFESALSDEKKINSEEEFRIRNLDQNLIQYKEWNKRKDESKQRIKELKEKANLLVKEKKKINSLPKEFKDKIKEFDIKLKNSIVEQKLSEDNLIINENEIRKIEKFQKEETKLLDDFKEKNTKIETELSILDTKIESLDERLNDRLSTSINDLVANLKNKIEFKDVSDHEILNLETSVHRLIRERDNLGTVNLRAATEIEELEKKLSNLQNEKKDLSLAIKKLENGIFELNKEGRERLLKSFNKVNDNFKQLFNRLFKGGKAELKFIGSEDPLNAGLEIYASPPGKKMQSLSLLSGGEQALTSISLIFASFLSNPSPLCILDEVDAALDDTNVSRFCELLKFLVNEQNISFLIVTHHRLTMANMNNLLGVTMQEKGISKLLSVDLEKAVEIKEAS